MGSCRVAKVRESRMDWEQLDRGILDRLREKFRSGTAAAKKAAAKASAGAVTACSCVAVGTPCVDPAGCLDWPNREKVAKGIAARIEVRLHVCVCVCVLR